MRSVPWAERNRDSKLGSASIRHWDPEYLGVVTSLDVHLGELTCGEGLMGASSTLHAEASWCLWNVDNHDIDDDDDG